MYIDNPMDDLSQARARLDQLLDETLERDPLDALKAIGEIESDLADHRRNAVRAAAGSRTWAEIGEAGSDHSARVPTLVRLADDRGRRKR
jgi:hypothetical protein